jgi:hypothetical protein
MRSKNIVLNKVNLEILFDFVVLPFLLAVMIYFLYEIML